MEPIEENAVYGNWVSTGLILRICAAFSVFGISGIAAWVLSPGWSLLSIVLTLLGVPFLIMVVYLCLARHLFSDRGAGVQNEIVEMLMSKIDWDGNGEVLDIGCGDAALTVRLGREVSQRRGHGHRLLGKFMGILKGTM